jgi:hypothetical protein
MIRRTIRGADQRNPYAHWGMMAGGFGSTNAGVLGGLLMMVIAVVWFVAGFAAGRIFFYPPILFIIGVVSTVKGMFSK